MSNVFREAVDRITGTSWLDDADRMSLKAAECKFSYIQPPFPAELIESASPHYGLLVIPFGEDGDVALILGHHDMRRAVAALNHYSRTVNGLLNMFDDLSTGYADAVSDIEQRWAKMLTRCRRAEQSGHKEDCETCWAISYEVRSGGWWVQYDYDQNEPGVFPVMVWHE